MAWRPSRGRATHSKLVGENIRWQKTNLPGSHSEMTVILLHASVRDGWQEIGDGVVEGLPLHQKTILIKWNALCVGSELGEDLVIRGVGKLAPVHLNGKFLEIVPSFKHGSEAAKRLTMMVFSKMEPAIIHTTTTSNANPLRSAWRSLKTWYMWV